MIEALLLADPATRRIGCRAAMGFFTLCTGLSNPLTMIERLHL